MRSLRKTKNQKGFALVECLAFMIAFVTLTAYTIDFFAAVHSAILGNIHARTYLFETLRHRSDIEAFRQDNTRDEVVVNNARLHMINDEDQAGDDRIPAVGRVLTAVREDDQVPSRFDGDRVSIISIRSAYGICVNARCGR
ncbi:MAG: hypothetical protein IT289_09805 [Oligoflexia bacterium]|nr:hypothetical protein [Oligoflexia bacterium]